MNARAEPLDGIIASKKAADSPANRRRGRGDGPGSATPFADTNGGGVRMLKPGRTSPTAGTRARKAALAAESDRHLDELIRRRLALPLEKRMNFLRG